MGEIEAVILTGGKSSRMGQDKAQLQVCGEPIALRIANSLSQIGVCVTIIGRSPVGDFAFIQDQEDYAGPLVALSLFRPVQPYVMVLSCDLPRFDPALVTFFHSLMGAHQAVVPVADGHLQPLCALYDQATFPIAEDKVRNGAKSVRGWLDCLDFRQVTQQEIADQGIDPRAICGANTPEEFIELTTD